MFVPLELLLFCWVARVLLVCEVRERVLRVSPASSSSIRWLLFFFTCNRSSAVIIVRWAWSRGLSRDCSAALGVRGHG